MIYIFFSPTIKRHYVEKIEKDFSTFGVDYTIFRMTDDRGRVNLNLFKYISSLTENGLLDFINDGECGKRAKSDILDMKMNEAIYYLCDKKTYFKKVFIFNDKNFVSLSNYSYLKALENFCSPLKYNALMNEYINNVEKRKGGRL